MFKLKKVDLVSSLAVPTAERLQFMDFTVPLIIQSYSIDQPMPKLESPLLAVIMPFRPLVRKFTQRNDSSKIYAVAKLQIAGVANDTRDVACCRWGVLNDLLLLSRTYWLTFARHCDSEC